MGVRTPYKGTCEYCLEYYEGQGKRFCSYECSRRHKLENPPKKNMLTRKCKFCNNEFSFEYKERKHRTCCSLECSKKSRKKYKTKKECRKASSPRIKAGVIKARAKKLGIDFCGIDVMERWIIETPQICAYCNIPFEVWEKLYTGHQNKYSLTIDRMNNNEGYIPSNLTFACSQCNIVKSNVLNFNEMVEIGQKYIKPKWQNKLKGASNEAFILEN